MRPGHALRLPAHNHHHCLPEPGELGEVAVLDGGQGQALVSVAQLGVPVARLLALRVTHGVQLAELRLLCLLVPAARPGLVHQVGSELPRTLASASVNCLFWEALALRQGLNISSTPALVEACRCRECLSRPGTRGKSAEQSNYLLCLVSENRSVVDMFQSQ